MSQMTKPKTELGSFIRNHRLALGITQQYLADKIGVTRAAISLIEIGYIKSLKMCVVSKIAEELNISGAELEKLKSLAAKKKRKIEDSPRKVIRRAIPLGDFLRGRRVESQFSQRELSIMSGVSSACISTIERKTIRPHSKTLYNLSIALHCKIPTELLG